MVIAPPFLCRQRWPNYTDHTALKFWVETCQERVVVSYPVRVGVIVWKNVRKVI